MRKIILSMTILATTAFCFNFALAQKGKGDFMGTITYDVKCEATDGEELDAQTKSQLPKQVIYTFKENKIRIEQVSPMGSQIILNDKDTKETVMLLDLMGNKVAIKSSGAEADSAKANMPSLDIDITGDSKEIAGYKCKKAVVKSDKETLDIWFTEEIPINDPNSLSPFYEIKGVLMEYTQVQNEIKMTLTVTEVKKGKPKDFLFSVPPGYQEMSTEELKEMLGG